MHNDEIKNKFIELRAQGWTLPRISEAISVPVSTLADWNHQHHERIQRLKLLVLERVEERILGDCQSQAEALATDLLYVQGMLDRKVRYDHGLHHLSAYQLVLMAGNLRSQLAKLSPRITAKPPPDPQPNTDPDSKP